MHRKIATLVFVLVALPALAAAQPVLTPPAHLPRPQHGSNLPTPHLPPIPPHYYFDCRQSYSALTHAYQWSVHNYGHNAAPVGLHFYAFIDNLHGEWVLTTPLGPDQTQVFGSPATSLDIPPRSGSQCEAYAVTTP